MTSELYIEEYNYRRAFLGWYVEANGKKVENTRRMSLPTKGSKEKQLPNRTIFFNDGNFFFVIKQNSNSHNYNNKNYKIRGKDYLHSDPASGPEARGEFGKLRIK